MRGTIWAGALLIAALMGGAAAAQNPPPEPGSTLEYREGRQKLREAEKLSAGPTDFEIARRRPASQIAAERQVADSWSRDAVALLQNSCRKNDANGCAELLYSHAAAYLPAPVADSRRTYALRAASLYLARCSAERELGASCRHYTGFLGDLKRGDYSGARNAIPDVKRIIVEGGRVFAKRCTATTSAPIWVSNLDCSYALQFLEVSEDSEKVALTAVREVLCSRYRVDQCEKLGKRPPT